MTSISIVTHNPPPPPVDMGQAVHEMAVTKQDKEDAEMDEKEVFIYVLLVAFVFFLLVGWVN